MVPAAVELDVVFERPNPAVDADLDEPPRPQGRKVLPELALAAAHDRRQHIDALVGRTAQHHLDDAVHRLPGDRPAALRAVRHADVGEQQAQVVVDLGDRPDGRAGVRPGGLLVDGNGGREAVDEVDVGFLHLLEELAGIGRQRFHVAPLPFGVDRVEGERRLARPRQPGDDDEAVAGQADVHALQVVDAGAAHHDAIVSHDRGPSLGASDRTHRRSRPPPQPLMLPRAGRRQRRWREGDPVPDGRRPTPVPGSVAAGRGRRTRRGARLREGPRPRIADYGSSARYQMGDVHARSWIRHGRSGSPHAAGRSSSGRAAHCSAFQRQLGFSTTRA